MELELLLLVQRHLVTPVTVMVMEPGEPVLRIRDIWSGSRPADPCLWLMDLDQDPAQGPAIFVTDLQDANKKLFFSKLFCLLVFEGAFT
jgi:hypothetical protein